MRFLLAVARDLSNGMRNETYNNQKHLTDKLRKTLFLYTCVCVSYLVEYEKGYLKIMNEHSLFVDLHLTNHCKMEESYYFPNTVELFAKNVNIFKSMVNSKVYVTLTGKCVTEYSYFT